MSTAQVLANKRRRLKSRLNSSLTGVAKALRLLTQLGADSHNPRTHSSKAEDEAELFRLNDKGESKKIEIVPKSVRNILNRHSHYCEDVFR